MFSRSGLTVTGTFMRLFKSFRSVKVVTSSRLLSDVIPVFSQRGPVLLSRSGLPPLPGTVLLSRSGLPPQPGTVLLSRSGLPPQPGTVLLSRSGLPPLPGTVLLSRSGLPPLPGTVVWFRSYSRNRQMPKKAGKGRPAGAGAAEAEPSGPVGRDRTGAVTITVHAKPGSKHSGITEVSAEAVGVAIAAPPTDGEANTELVRYLAEVLELKKSHISLDKGSRSRDKLIRVDSSLSPEEVLRRLRQAAG